MTVKPVGRQLIHRGDILQRRHVVAKQPLVRRVIRRLAMIDAGRIDADHANPPPRNQPIGRGGIKPGKMQLGECRFALLRRA